MNKILIKLGGSNLKSTSDINKIINVVKSYQQPVVIVVSAFYGITDQLNTLIAELKKEDHNALDCIEKICEPYTAAIDEYIQKTISNRKLKQDFYIRKNELISVCEQLCLEPYSINLQNQILSFGEKFSSLVLSHILNEKQIVCKEALPEYIGLISNENLQNASVSLSSNLEVIEQSLKEDICYIIPGFYATSPKGETTLFGRGGSDYTAAVIAYALKAQSLDLWKDVSGFLSADPKIVDQPLEIDSLSYLEAAELSYFGAKIIHPGTIRPLIKGHIPLNIFDINSNLKETPKGTHINGTAKESNTVLKSITYNDEFVLLKLKGSGVGIKKGILLEVTQLFDAADINIRSVITSQIEIDFLLHKDDLYEAYSIVESLQNNFYDIQIEDQISLIAAVGRGVKQAAGIAGTIFGALASQNINIKHIVFGASDVAIYLIVSQKDCKTAMQVIHQKVFTPNPSDHVQ